MCAVRTRTAIRLTSGAAAALLGACAFTDVFKESGPGNVSFVTDDTVVTRGTAIAFNVALVVDGAPAGTPSVQLIIPDSTRIKFNTTGDSVSGLQVGVGNVVAWIETSLAARVDTILRIRVRP